MHAFKFGSGPGIAPVLPAWVVPVIRYVVYCLLVTAALVILKLAARGGCSLPPELPLTTRYNDLCVLLRRGPGCRMRVKPLDHEVTVESDELDYRVYVDQTFVGEWPIANGEPIDPSLMTKEIVSYHLQYMTGDPEFQDRLRTQFHCRRIGFIEGVLDWQLGVTHVLAACAS